MNKVSLERFAHHNLHAGVTFFECARRQLRLVFSFLLQKHSIIAADNIRNLAYLDSCPLEHRKLYNSIIRLLDINTSYDGLLFRRRHQ